MLVFDRRSFLTSTAVGTVASVCSGGSAAAIGSLDPPSEAAGLYSFTFGDFRIAPVCDGVFHLPMDSIAVNVDADERKTYFQSRHMSGDALQLQATPLLINAGDKLTLVDTGVAPGSDWAPKAGRLFRSLKHAGVEPSDIDIIVITHCHVDHVGGLQAAAAEGFAKAEVVISETEFDLWNSPDAASKVPEWASAGVPGLQKTFAALGDRIRRVKDGAEIAPGVNALATPGHTPGHMSLLINAGSDAMLVTGDAIASVHVAFEHPEWQVIWDHDRDLGAKTRSTLLDRAANEKLLVVGYHFPFPGLGHVVKHGTAYGWLPADWVWDE